MIILAISICRNLGIPDQCHDWTGRQRDSAWFKILACIAGKVLKTGYLQALRRSKMPASSQRLKCIFMALRKIIHVDQRDQTESSVV